MERETDNPTSNAFRNHHHIPIQLNPPSSCSPNHNFEILSAIVWDPSIMLASCMTSFQRIILIKASSTLPSSHLIIDLGFGSLGCQCPAIPTFRVLLMFDCDLGKMTEDVLHLGVASASALTAKVVEP